MTVLALAEAEERVRLAQDALSGAAQGGNPNKIAEAQGQLMLAERDRVIAFHADEIGNCSCGTCTGRASWDD